MFAEHSFMLSLDLIPVAATCYSQAAKVIWTARFVVFVLIFA